MSQAGTPGAGTESPSELRRVVASQAGQLTQLQAELQKAFPTVQSQIRVLETTSKTTVDSVAGLTSKMDAMSGALASIQQSLDTLASRTSPASPPDTSPSSIPVRQPIPRNEPSLINPRAYEGDFNQCRGFLAQCELLFTHQPSKYAADGAKIAFVISLLADRALSWAVAAIETNATYATDYSQFKRELRSVFDHPSDGQNVASRLLICHQGSRSVADFTVEFRILAAESGWNDQALLSLFRKGLSDSIKDLIVRDNPGTLNELITLALQMDARLRERRSDRATRFNPPHPNPSRPHTVAAVPSASGTTPPPFQRALPPALTAPTSGFGEPMEIGRSRLSREEREHRMSHQQCLYCGKEGHFVRACPARPNDPARR